MKEIRTRKILVLWIREVKLLEVAVKLMINKLSKNIWMKLFKTILI